MIIFAEITNQIISFQELFTLSKYQYVLTELLMFFFLLGCFCLVQCHFIPDIAGGSNMVSSEHHHWCWSDTILAVWWWIVSHHIIIVILLTILHLLHLNCYHNYSAPRFLVYFTTVFDAFKYWKQSFWIWNQC